MPHPERPPIDIAETEGLAQQAVAHAKMLTEIADALDSYFRQREVVTGYENQSMLGHMLARRISNILYGGAG